MKHVISQTILFQKFEGKYEFNYNRVVKVECVTKFLDKIENETKDITIDSYNIIGRVNKIMQSSKGMCKYIRRIELKIIIERRIYKNVIDICLKSENVPFLWKKINVKIANDRDNGLKSFNKQHRERHFILSIRNS